MASNLLLALAAGKFAEHPEKLTFLDCDVEEPNAHIFLKPQITRSEDVGLLIPKIDPALCTYCGRCAEVCAYNAITLIGKKVLVFPELCHGCGSCTYNCPTGAISEELKPTGKLEWGNLSANAGKIAFGQGVMNIGEAMATPIINKLKQRGMKEATEGLTILDAPPGNSCPVVETMRDTDFVLLVTEPTPFGLHDLQAAVQVARDELGLPVAVVINRVGVGDESVEEFCAEQEIPILLRIPLDRRIAEAYADGVTLGNSTPSIPC